MEKLPLAREEQIRQDALKHPNISPYGIAIIQFVEGKLEPDSTLFRKLASDVDLNYRIRELVAQNSSVSADILELLTKNLSVGIGHTIALNPKASPKTLDIILEYEYERQKNFGYSKKTCRAIARHPNTSSFSLEWLAACGDKHIHQELIKNPNISDYGVSIINSIASKSIPDLKLLWNKFTSIDSYPMQQLVAKNGNTPQVILTELAKNSNKDIRARVATNHSSPANILESLAKDTDSLVRAAVAENPASPINIIDSLSHDMAWLVREGVAKNTHTPKEILDKLAKDNNNKVCQTAIINKRIRRI